MQTFYSNPYVISWYLETMTSSSHLELLNLKVIYVTKKWTLIVFRITVFSSDLLNMRFCFAQIISVSKLFVFVIKNLGFEQSSTRIHPLIKPRPRCAFEIILCCVNHESSLKNCSCNLPYF
jgi:hypothetical protein